MAQNLYSVDSIDADEDSSISNFQVKMERYDDEFTLLSIVPPENGDRTPCDICCVIDTSGSMGDPAKTVSGGEVENTGLSVMDVVKHGIRTIIHTLTSDDRLALVSFSTEAKKVCDLTFMDDSGKQQALSSTEAFTPDGNTNIWGGLEKGMDILYASVAEGRFPVLVLLTDGQPNVVPPRGHLPMLQKYAKNKGGKLPCRINTFGFGYSLDSKLLHELAVEGGGMYSFIPDCSFVGTVFSNALSNYLSTVATDVVLSINIPEGGRILDYEVLGGHPKFPQNNGRGLSVNLGSLIFGQNKDLVIKNKTELFPIQAALTFLEVASWNSATIQQTEVPGNGNEFMVNRLRLEMVDRIRKAMVLAARKQLDSASNTILESVTDIQEKLNTYNGDSPEIPAALSGFLADLDGEVISAVSKQEYYDKWGLHYLPSLMQAHLLQQCNNFKDPGIQNYGGTLFKDIRDTADEIFCKLPPPTPSIVARTTARAAPPAPVITSMAVLHNSSAPCFAGTCIVQMGDNSTKEVQQVVAGDFVSTNLAGEGAKVLCVVKTEVREGKLNLVAFEGGLLVTPYHPIKIKDEWVFPVDMAQVTAYSCDAVYSFVLETSHVMLINGIPCITLGHGFTDNKVLAHPYLGTNAVIEDLKAFEGWHSGMVVLKPENVVRSAATPFEPGKICALKAN